ncbi:hypothetical protein VXQ18_01010 [Brucella abortus]|nr:hypothetical protein [Brucella abortus]
MADIQMTQRQFPKHWSCSEPPVITSPLCGPQKRRHPLLARYWQPGARVKRNASAMLAKNEINNGWLPITMPLEVIRFYPIFGSLVRPERRGLHMKS